MIFRINTIRNISKLSQITYNHFEIPLVVLPIQTRQIFIERVVTIAMNFERSWIHGFVIMFLKGAVSRHSSSFCLILPITRPHDQSLGNLK